MSSISSDDSVSTISTNSISPENPGKGDRRRSRFYISTVTFLVEESLFKVPRIPFEEGSETFRDMFKLPTSEHTIVEGDDDEHPIRLDGIKRLEFEQLLETLFDSKLWRRSPKKRRPRGTTEWKSVLKLSTMWGFNALRSKAIAQLASMSLSAVDKIVIANQYDINDWLLPCFNELAKRPEPIGADDVDKLGLDTALKIAAVRESIAFVPANQSQSGSTAFGSSSSSSTMKQVVGDRDAKNLDFTTKIKQVFSM
ncbi:hypothetical protein BV22DRAFT_1049622 [Leucogyrophana mollusca]|uniref:Uncharacterized protein n=1 Tax=Leucogyrophana mollusca TaxID=85980 RepID=A0ACB8B706_9AGAM|nr:hypothetical protein BV22DRAFT_1049622 [Leucogyrophana mollusca]